VTGKNPLAVASLVCSICGILPVLGLLGIVLGIVFGFVARSQIARGGNLQGGKGLALAGIIIGFAIIPITLAIAIPFFLGVSAHGCGNSAGCS
jgi:hypothetical protein